MSRLHYAARRGLLTELEAGIAAGLPLDEQTAHHDTPLDLAAQNGHVAIVERLLAAGADPAITHPNGSTALHSAAGGGHLAIVKALIEHGMPVDTKTKKGTTPALRAAIGNRAETVRYLLAQGADPNVTRDGLTVLEWIEAGGLSGRCKFPPQSPEQVAANHQSFAYRLMSEEPDPDRYAAAHGRRLIVFSLGVVDLPDPIADRWAKRVRAILRDPEELAACEERYLEGADLAEARHCRAARERRIQREAAKAAMRA